ncbi:PL29 family lyase N-terminal domain-containing protein [Massilibacteroides vaginae]|uniref:PL29 family lyase N-terminal domain-containing protein n=1 Tax=Massilibacteroides vaginae TaxID=1673718 RepID=UPI000A1CDCCA|nr:PL29 family lyase N-terminal domain-containing protein [Massilibacteroides vaginae]
MKTVNSILGIILSLTFLLSGCMKDDIDELRRQQAESDERLTALEDWQKSTNSQIASLQGLVNALENNDYVTGVSPVKEDGVEIAYTISFSKSSPITIYHGKKGEKGDAGKDAQAPSIGIAKHTDSKYYWTLDGQWLLDESGKKIPVTGDKGDKGDQGNQGATGSTGAQGQNGVPPKVAIGSDNYWYISTNGTATGIPPAIGWTSTGVKATGAKGDIGPVGPTGPQGDQGDAIFAADGIDLTNEDYVIFTLADGVTTIKLPKYKSIGISFDQPGIFAAGTTQTINYTSTGTTEPTNIRIVDVPVGWKVTVNSTQKTFTVVAPTTIAADNFEGEPTVLIGIDNEVVAMYGLKIRAEGFYRVGDYYPDPMAIYENGVLKSGTVAVGVVFLLDNHSAGDYPYSKVSRHGKMVGLYERVVGTLDETWATDYGITYNAAAGWYMPAYGANDYDALYCAYNGMTYETWNIGKPNDISKNYTERTWFRTKITDAGGDNITDSWYWVSSRDAIGNAYRLHFNSGNVEISGFNLSSNKTRAIKTF